MEQKEYTIKEIVDDAVQTLSKLPIPVEFKLSIADPVFRVVCNLRSCVAAFERQEQEAEDKKKGADE